MKFKKKFLIFILVFVIFILAIILAAPYLINIDKIRTAITEKIREKYNYEIKIDSFRLSLFPGVKIKGGGISIKSLTSLKGQYIFDIKASALEASVKIIPLLQRRVEIGKILIYEPVIILEEKVLSRSLEDKTRVALSPEIKMDGERQKRVEAGQKDTPVSISISTLSIKKGRIKVSSDTLLPPKIKEIELSEVNLSASPLALNEFMKIRLQSSLMITEKTGKNIFQRPINISLDKNIKIEEKKITLQKLKLDIESISILLSGSLNLKEKLIEANLSIKEAKLDSLASLLNLGGGSIAGLLNFEGAFNGNPEKGILKGKISLSDGNFNKVAFQNLSSDLNYENNTIALSPIEVSLYDGHFNGSIKAGVNEEPDFSFQGEIKGLSIEKLLRDTTGKDIVQGKAFATIGVKGRGKSFSNITQTLAGDMHVEMRDGKITTLNLLRDILTVAGLLTGMRPPEGDYTRVDSLTADVVIGGGKARTDNLYLVSRGLEVTGSGYFNYDQTIDFTMDAYVGSHDGMKESGGFIGRYMKDKYGRLVIPIRVSGPAAKPRVSLDAQRMVQGILEKEIKDILPGIFK